MSLIFSSCFDVFTLPLSVYDYTLSVHQQILSSPVLGRHGGTFLLVDFLILVNGGGMGTCRVYNSLFFKAIYSIKLI